MKYLLFAIFLLTVSCKDEPSSSKSSGKKPSIISGTVVLVPSPKALPKFNCTEENICHDSIVVVEDGSNFCQGVVKDGEVIIANECGQNFKCSTMTITSTSNESFSCEEIKTDNNTFKIRTKEDISSINSELAILSKDDLTLNAVTLKKVDGQFVQEKNLCAITLSSIRALSSTKLNSLFLAIKDCDNLPVGSVLFQEDKLVSINTKSDIFNISQSLVCGDDCDNKEVDKLEFLIDEITAKTKVKKLRESMITKEYNGTFTYQQIKIHNNENLISVPHFKCISRLETISLNTIIIENSFNKYGEIANSKPKVHKKQYIHTERIITLTVLGGDVLKYSSKNKSSILGVLTNTHLLLLEDLNHSLLTDKSITLQKVEVAYCNTPKPIFN